MSSPLVCRVSVERSAVILIGISLYVICCFSLTAVNICCLWLNFVSLINMCLGVFLLGFTLYGLFWASWMWVVISLPILGKFLTIISSNIFSCPFILSSSSGMPMIKMLGCLTSSHSKQIVNWHKDSYKTKDTDPLWGWTFWATYWKPSLGVQYREHEPPVLDRGPLRLTGEYG